MELRYFLCSQWIQGTTTPLPYFLGSYRIQGNSIALFSR